MTVETVQRTRIYWDYSNPPDDEQIRELNLDLEKMETNVRVSFDFSPDGTTLVFTKEEIE